MTVKIVCLLDQGFEDWEFQDPYDQFRAAGSSPARGFQRGRT
jgi:putative intracellular protease/amidase